MTKKNRYKIKWEYKIFKKGRDSCEAKEGIYTLNYTTMGNESNITYLNILSIELDKAIFEGKWFQ